MATRLRHQKVKSALSTEWTVQWHLQGILLDHPPRDSLLVHSVPPVGVFQAQLDGVHGNGTELGQCSVVWRLGRRDRCGSYHSTGRDKDQSYVVGGVSAETTKCFEVGAINL